MLRVRKGATKRDLVERSCRFKRCCGWRRIACRELLLVIEVHQPKYDWYQALLRAHLPCEISKGAQLESSLSEGA